MSTIDDTSVRPGRLAPRHGVAAGRTLAAAFQDDPVFRWVAPDAGIRRTYLPRWFEVVAEAIAAHGVSHRADDGEGIALWVLPDVPALTDAEGERLGEATVALGAEAVERSAALTQAMEAAHPWEPHHYLWLLGVTPERQGRGVGAALLGWYVAELDRADEAAYLEATSPSNRRLYERHGFEVTGIISAGPGAPPLWAMWRTARRGGWPLQRRAVAAPGGEAAARSLDRGSAQRRAVRISSASGPEDPGF